MTRDIQKRSTPRLGIICPMINNRAEAREFVGSCAYAPSLSQFRGRSALALCGADYP